MKVPASGIADSAAPLLTPARTSRLAVAALLLACFSFPVAHVQWLGVGRWPLPMVLMVSCPLAALACAVIAMGRIRRSRGGLNSEWAARLALLLTILEILFVSMAFELPMTPWGVVNVALSILLVSLCVYALWPARDEDRLEFRVVTHSEERRSEPDHG